jgi:hypothetical protein
LNEQNQNKWSNKNVVRHPKIQLYIIKKGPNVMKGNSKVVKILLILFLTSIIISACTSQNDRVWLNPPGWSRGQYIGTTRNFDGAPICVDDNGNTYIFLMESAQTNMQPVIVALNQNAEVIWKTHLDITHSQAKELHLLLDNNILQLFWNANKVIYSARLNLFGEVVSLPKTLSGNLTVGNFDVVKSPEGEFILWYAGDSDSPGLYHVTINQQVSNPSLIDPAGTRPNLKYDINGDLHAVWTYYPAGYHDPAIFYGHYKEGNVNSEGQKKVQEITLGPTNQLTGPWMGVDNQNIYIFWSIYIRTGLSAGSSYTEGLTFPFDHAVEKPASTLRVPWTYLLEYDEIPKSLIKGGQRVSLASYQAETTSGIAEMTFNPTPSEELSAVFNSQMQYRWRKERGQVCNLFFQDGAPSTYQMITFSSTNSSAPMLISDKDGYLYLTWMERAEEQGFLVYLASTSPSLNTSLGGLRTRDISQLAGEMLFGMLVGFVISPFTAAIWMILPMFLLLLTIKLRPGHHRKIGKIGSAISVVLAISVFWVVKINTLNGFESFVPFSPWIPTISDLWSKLLQILIPIIIFIVSMLLAWNYTYRRNSESALNFMLIYIAVDAALMSSFYGLLIFEAI